MRALSWDGYLNVRDLGGLPTTLSSDGGTVHGRIARGPRRERITRAGWEDARAWGLSSVIDLRCAYEIGPLEGDPVVPPEASAGVTIVNVPTEDQDDPDFREVCFPILDSPEYWQHNWRIQPELVRATLEAIACARPGILIHCSAGRDRTGMVSALLLGNAGVAPDAVAEDYASSVHAMAGAAHHGPTSDRQASWSPQDVDYWIGDKLSIVRDVVTHTQDIFDLLELTPGTRAALRGLLVDH